MTAINDHPSQVAYRECGAHFAGTSRQEFFAAAEQHLAHHRRQLLGALELDVVSQMGGECRGAHSA